MLFNAREGSVQPLGLLDGGVHNCLMHSSNELQAIYSERFSAHIEYRRAVWRVLVSQYFSKFVPPDAHVLDLGCGYGEFINHVSCKKKLAMDLNTRAREYLSQDVDFILQDCCHAWPIPDDSLDVVFTSNFFEHLASKDALRKTLEQVRRCLKPGGRIVAMGPNIKYIGGAYWDFWDHHLALTHSSLSEALRVLGFDLDRVVQRFLPYTMVNRRRVPSVLVRMYLQVPWAWGFFGKQFLIVASKPK